MRWWRRWRAASLLTRTAAASPSVPGRPGLPRPAGREASGGLRARAMLHPVLSLTFELCLLLAVAQAGCLFLARGLGVRLEWRSAAVALALPLLFLSPFLLDDTLLAPTGVIAGMLPLHGLPPVRFSHLIQSDTIYQFLPWELEVRHALRAHRLPLWSALLDGGSSPWINPQAGVLWPRALLARAVPLPWFLLAMLALQMLLACEGPWLLSPH